MNNPPICGRCAGLVRNGRTVRMTPSRDTVSEITLCSACSGLFAEWLAQGDPGDGDRRDAALSRYERAKLIDALSKHPHTAGSIRSYVLPAVQPADILEALQELSSSGVVEAHSERLRGGVVSMVYRLASTGGQGR